MKKGGLMILLELCSVYFSMQPSSTQPRGSRRVAYLCDGRMVDGGGGGGDGGGRQKKFSDFAQFFFR